MEERDQIQNRLTGVLEKDIAKKIKLGNHAEAARQQVLLNKELKKLQAKPDVGDELTRRFQSLMSAKQKRVHSDCRLINYLLFRFNTYLQI